MDSQEPLTMSACGWWLAYLYTTAAREYQIALTPPTACRSAHGQDAILETGGGGVRETGEGDHECPLAGDAEEDNETATVSPIT